MYHKPNNNRRRHPRLIQKPLLSLAMVFSTIGMERIYAKCRSPLATQEAMDNLHHEQQNRHANALNLIGSRA